MITVLYWRKIGPVLLSKTFMTVSRNLDITLNQYEQYNQDE